jgi:diaminopimelate epimerase
MPFFFRAHGLGNDYLVLSHPAPLTPARVRAVCDRHRGVGSDGILEPIAPPEGSHAAIGLRIHNPDGSLAEKSGNGLRIFAWWLVARQGFPAGFSVWTQGGEVRCLVDRDVVTVDMGAARILGDALLAGVPVVRVDVGNPHAVVLGGWEALPGARGTWQEVGAAVETSVPGRTNVQFVQVRDGLAHARIWERGAGETLASGSSACAVAAVCVARGLLASPVTVRMPGGDLHVEVDAVGQVRQTGPVAPVGDVDVHPAWWAACTALDDDGAARSSTRLDEAP